MTTGTPPAALLDEPQVAALDGLAHRYGLTRTEALGAVGVVLIHRLTTLSPVTLAAGTAGTRAVPLTPATTFAEVLAGLAAAPPGEAGGGSPVPDVVVTGPGAQVAAAHRLLGLRVAGTGEGRAVTAGAAADPAEHPALVPDLLAERLSVLLAALLAAPEAAVAAAEVTGPGERRLLASFRGAETEVPDAPVPELIRRRALAHPGRIALREGSGELTLTYGELLDRAAATAGRLAAAGVGRGDVVGLCAERGASFVVAVLGIMLAGGAYLPLDPSHPGRRLAEMVRTARAKAVLASPAGTATLVGEDVPQLLALSGDGQPDARAWDWRAEAAPVGGGDLAYVIFTSGSTGHPKGVEVGHAALLNRLVGMQDAYRLAADDVVLHKTPATFDVSLGELLAPFMYGARQVVAPPDAHRDAAAMVELIRREQVTTVHFVPSMLALFLAEPDVGGCVSLRRVLCSGEALPPTVVNRLTDLLPVEVHNLYGPTEAAIEVTAWRCRRPEPEATVPIGAPIANVVVHVLDGRGRLAPVGVPGEMHLGGRCLARGYAGSPELTAEWFVELPVAGRAERLYRTGDLVWWDPAGRLRFVGRIDDQVKIRGQRVEPGEIEATLREHPAVDAAVVVVRRRGPGAEMLVGYVVPGAGREPGETDERVLRAFLATRLPGYMVPARVVPLAALPFTASGKVDRRALPEPPPRRRVGR